MRSPTLAEATLRLGRSWVAARFEDAQKDELFPHIHVAGGRVPTVSSAAIPDQGCNARLHVRRLRARERARRNRRNYTAYAFPEILKVFYGARPCGRMLYIRTRWGT